VIGDDKPTLDPVPGEVDVPGQGIEGLMFRTVESGRAVAFAQHFTNALRIVAPGMDENVGDIFEDLEVGGGRYRFACWIAVVFDNHVDLRVDVCGGDDAAKPAYHYLTVQAKQHNIVVDLVSEQPSRMAP
jgi:hypothetical protein